MKKSMMVALVVGLLLATVTAAGAETGSLPGGTAISVDITSPTNGGFVLESETVTLEGTASVGMGAADKDTSLVYILDVSGSTGQSAGVDCDGVPGNDTVLECEKAAVSKVNADAAAPGSPVLNSGLGEFASSGIAHQGLVAPGPAIEAALDLVSSPGGGTSFSAGLDMANDILTGGGAAANKIVVFLTDGDGSGSSPLPAGTIVLAFAFGGAGCSPGLVAISDDCEVVDDLSDLDEVIGASIGSTLDSLSYKVNGGASTALPATPGLPAGGPADVTFSLGIGSLPLGEHEVCVTAAGTDGGGTGTVTDCVSFDVVQTMVDCSDPEVECVAVATDGGVSTATVVGTSSFNKMLGVRPVTTDPGECAGDDCVTGYDVLFDGAGDVGVVEMTVVASKKNSTPPGQAAVYIDGVEITAKCHKDAGKSPIPCAKITKIKGGLTQYFVRFNADPGFRFK